MIIGSPVISDLFMLFGLCAGGWAVYYFMKGDRDWLTMALNSVGDALITTKRNGNIITINLAAEKLTGWKRKEAVGKPLAEILQFLNHDTRLPLEAPLAEALASGKVAQLPGHSMLRCRDGSEIPVECVATPISGKRARSVRGAVIICRDISARYLALQNLAESEGRLRAVTNQARVGLVMIDRDRRYVYANNFYMEMIGFSDMFVMGKRVQDVLPVIYERIRPHLDRAFAGERVSYEVYGNNKKELGLNRLYSVTYEPQLRQSLVLNVVIVVLDITDIRKAVSTS